MTSTDVQQTPGTGRTASGSRGNLRWVLLPVALGIGYLLLGYFVLQPGHSSCNDGSNDRARIQQLVAEGQPGVAAGLANLALSQSDTCDSAKPALANLEYRASMQDIYGHPELDGPNALKRWQLAVYRATGYGVSVDSPLVVADNAYHAGLWEFARDAFQQGWRGQPDEHQLPLYYSILRNWGIELLHSDQERDQEDGLRVLATSCAIATTYSLQQQEACTELDEYAASNGVTRPAPLSDDAILDSAP